MRIEFTDLPSFMTSSFKGAGSGTSVQFYATSTSSANYAILDPAHYSQASPSVVTTAMSNGDRSKNTNISALYQINNGVSLSTANPLRAIQDIGSVWGIAYDRRNGIVYTSAFLKRHADLGPQGIAGLYWGTRSGPGLVNTGSSNLNSLTGNSFGLDPRSDGVGHDDNLTGVEVTAPSRDRDAYLYVGKRGIGDIDGSPDGKTLYVMNLNERKLEAFDVSAVPAGGNPTYIGNYTITDPGCNNGDYRPFAVKVVNPDMKYVGVTCSAETSGDRSHLLAYFCKIVPSAGFGATSTIVPILDNDLPLPTNANYSSAPQPPPAPPANAIPLYYNRADESTDNTASNYQFGAWTDTWPGTNPRISSRTTFAQQHRH